MLFADVAAASEAVGASSARNQKVAALAAALRQAGPAGSGSPGGPAGEGAETEIRAVTAWLAGATRQRRTGLGWASVRDRPPPAEVATLTVTEVDDAFSATAVASGPGSAGLRQAIVGRLLAAATRPEQRLLAGLVSGELRQGAGAGLMIPAVAAAAGVAIEAVRRALSVHGDLPDVALAALTGGEPALAGFTLAVGRALAPMLAQPGSDLDTALAKTGAAGVEWKLDGVRAQLHRDGDDVAVFTRTLDDITGRVPDVVAAVRQLPVRRAILDGELLALRPDGRPAPFQATSARVMRRDATASTDVPLQLTVFDLLHADGEDLIGRPGAARREQLEAVAPGLVVPRHLIDDPGDDEQRAGARAFAAGALAAGHEGVVVKGLDVPYTMGRRGAGWVKVKPRITVDLVVLAAEWGHGRRTGLLSNLHLGARDPDGTYGPAGGFVMLGKTFKGLTDEMLRWQTDRLQELAVGAAGAAPRWQVDVRPELVVEIAFDGVQTSRRYPAGMALRFARVLAHRPDKPAGEADTVATVRAHHLPES